LRLGLGKTKLKVPQLRVKQYKITKRNRPEIKVKNCNQGYQEVRFDKLKEFFVHCSVLFHYSSVYYICPVFDELKKMADPSTISKIHIILGKTFFSRTRLKTLQRSYI
jgi:hypothetical protein